MHRLAIKRNTKNEAHISPNTHLTAFVRPRIGTVPFAAPADTCADTAECRLQCMCRGVRTANLHAVRSAITATAELLVVYVIDCNIENIPFLVPWGARWSSTRRVRKHKGPGPMLCNHRLSCSRQMKKKRWAVCSGQVKTRTMNAVSRTRLCGTIFPWTIHRCYK